jgi:hypothetical protein
MEEKKTLKQDCGCDSDCCQPKKNNNWKKFIFIAVILAAGIIVTVKLVGNKNANSQVNTETSNIQAPKNGCDTSVVNTCTKLSRPENKSSCCPK